MGQRRKKALEAHEHWRGMRTKILLWFLVPTALVLIAVTALSFYTYRRLTRELVLERNLSHTELLAGQLAAKLEEYTGPLTVIGNSEEALSGLPRSQARILEDNWPVGQLARFDGGVLFLSPDGIVTATSHGLQSILGLDLSILASSPEEIREESIGFSDILVGTVAQSDVIALSLPIWREPNTIEGTIVGLFGPTWHYPRKPALSRYLAATVRALGRYAISSRAGSTAKRASS